MVPSDKREDLHNIYNPILKSTIWYTKDNPDILNIFKLAKKGLERLKNSYETSSIISHSLELYINIIDLFISSNKECIQELYQPKTGKKVFGGKLTTKKKIINYINLLKTYGMINKLAL